jgi:type II secretory pathway pseudopilin PulG
MFHPRAVRRPAFTLVEILVVIGIILLLMALSIAAVMKVKQARERKLTQSSINSLYTAFNSHWNATIDTAKQQTGNYGPGSAVYQMAGQDINRARVIWIKMCLAQQFPARYSEALAPCGGNIAAEASYGKILSTKTNPNYNPSKTNPATESAACLLMALTARDRRGVNVSKDYLGSLQMQDTDGDGIPEIVDNYGNPIVFVRWPLPTDTTQSDGNYLMINSWDATYATEKFHDSQDPIGTLQAPNWTGSATYQSAVHPLSAPYPSLYVVPVIISAGPDGVLGLNWTPGSLDIGVNAATTNASNDPAYLDNIYSNPTQITP